jgi:tetratricopeptide (TPR) repeat protein
MVGIEGLLKRVQEAETETERQWILLELQMNQMPNDLVSMLWASAIPHFFDANILAALRPELAKQAEKLYENLKSLTFVEEFPDQGYNLHELTRNVLLNKLWQDDREEFLRLSQRVADYFFQEKTSSEKDVEFCYHEILSEGKAQTGRLLDRVIDWWTDYQADRIQGALQGFLEHERADRLDSFGKGLSLHLQGLIERRSGHYAEAESLFIRAESFYGKIELKNPYYITTLLRDLGSSKQEQGDYQGSIPFFEKALVISEEQLGENDPDTATSLNSLASLYQAQGKYEESKLLHLRALKIYEEQLGENHPNTANNLNNLAKLYQKQELYSDAIPLLERWKNIKRERQETRNTEYADRICTLGKLYEKCQQFPEAVENYEEALSIFKFLLDSKHPRIRVLQAELNRLKKIMEKSKRKS